MGKKTKSKKISARKNRSVKQVSETSLSDWWGKGKWSNLFRHVDIASLVFFRICFGLILCIDFIEFISKGWVEMYFIKPIANFTYWPFEWLSPLPGNGMYYFFYGMLVLSIMVAIGLFYRVAITLIFIGFTYFFLLEQANYLNHNYLICLVSFVMIFLPLNKSFSLDAKIFKNIRSETSPVWQLWLIRFMIALPYFFGGVAKINMDWLNGLPFRPWLAYSNKAPAFMKRYDPDGLGYFLSYSGMLLDLLIVPALLYKRTRIPAFIFITCFHLLNANMFTISIFPWLMIFATTVYFEPNWPRNLWNSLSKKTWKLVLPAKENLKAPAALSRNQKITMIALCFWVAFHCLVPLRHLLIPGKVHWTEEGHKYSWRMMLRSKIVNCVYIIEDPNTHQVLTTVNPKDYFPSWQVKSLITRPVMLWEGAQILEKEFFKMSGDVIIRANVSASLNGREYQNLIDPKIDLTAQPRPVFPPTSWILPLETPRPKNFD